MSAPGGAEAEFLAPRPSSPVPPLSEPPAISVVIPAYNAARTVGGAIRSVLEQVRPAHEVIVVDDGSTDGTASVLAAFAGRVTVVVKENGGYASALNAGTAVASGSFVAGLDADDAYHPRRLEALGRLAAARPDLDVLATDARFVVDGEPVGCFLDANPFPLHDQRGVIVSRCFVVAAAFRRSSLLAVGGFDASFRGCADWDCVLRLVLDGARAGLVNRPYYDYRLHEESLTADRVGTLWERVRMLENAAGHPSLTPAELRRLALSRRGHRTRAVLADAAAHLGGRGSRRRLLRLALARDIELRGRATVALAAVNPLLGRPLVPLDLSPRDRYAAPQSPG